MQPAVLNKVLQRRLVLKVRFQIFELRIGYLPSDRKFDQRMPGIIGGFVIGGKRLGGITRFIAKESRSFVISVSGPT